MGEKIQEKVSLKKAMKKLAQKHPELAITAGAATIAVLRPMSAILNNVVLKFKF